MANTTYRKKLIEVALPLQAINEASAREKSIRHGHPSTLHLWWARRPLAACRAVLFASLVNDPEDDPMYGVDEDTAYTERAKLFDLIEQLVQWENSNNPAVIDAARLEIARSIAANQVADKELSDDTPLVASAQELPEEQAKYLPDPPPEYTPHDVRFKMPGLKPEQVNHFLAHYAPPVLDPFAGGGSIPLEAQRLGLRAYASDLNPIPVLINKALIEFPPRFADQSPVNPDSRVGQLKSKQWQGAEGLAADVRYYGKWMRDEAEKRIGHLYPRIKVTQEMVNDGRPDLEPYLGQELTVLAWLWARTVKSPNPAANGNHIPLVRSFWLGTKPNKERWIIPVVDRVNCSISFRIGVGKPPAEFDPGESLVGRRGARCLLTDTPVPLDYVRKEAKAGHMSDALMAIVCEGNRERVYLNPLSEHAVNAKAITVGWKPTGSMPKKHRNFQPPVYGMDDFSDLFTNRQLVLLKLFTDLLKEVQTLITDNGATSEYAEAVTAYLGLAVSKSADGNSTVCSWMSGKKYEVVRTTFSRQALPMTWDYAESNPFAGSSGDFNEQVGRLSKVLEVSIPRTHTAGVSLQSNATAQPRITDLCISTDPPYYDNIAYAELSDFFYIWLRECFGESYSELFGTIVSPKKDELVAASHRFQGDQNAAGRFFEHGLQDAFARAKASTVPTFPITVYYAFKQSETEHSDGTSVTASTGWETMLEGLLKSGLSISATWPVRTERSARTVSIGTNALASSIVLACRHRFDDAPMVTRREFADALHRELPDAIKHLQLGNVAPVDLAQASIGPGMAVFSRYSKVVNADGTSMSVREALQLINQVLDESLVEQELDFDSETRFALRWFEQFGLQEGPFGDAETLAKAMAVSVRGVEEAGIAKSNAGKVRLLKREELDPDWAPNSDKRLTMWEVTQYLIHRLESGGETGAAELVRDVSSDQGEIAKELAYRLYQTCDRKKWSEEARRYNAFVASWPEITRLSRQSKTEGRQSGLF